MSKADTEKRTPLLPAVLVGSVVIVASGAIHGQLSQRWGPGGELARVAARLDDFPRVLGPWRMQSSEPLTTRVIDTLQCANYVNRIYLNTETAEQISLLVIAGPPGPTAVHTPEICYSSRAYSQEGESKVFASEAVDDRHTFWRLQFRENQAGGDKVHVYYAWTDDGVWRASEAPRYVYGGKPYLCKIQLQGSVELSSASYTSDLCQRFLEDLLETDWAPTDPRS